MTAHMRLAPPLVESIRKALTGKALPGEVQSLSREAERSLRDAQPFLQRAGERLRREGAGGDDAGRGELGDLADLDADARVRVHALVHRGGEALAVDGERGAAGDARLVGAREDEGA